MHLAVYMSVQRQHKSVGDMRADEENGYAHRKNYDETFDSICTKCARTVGTSESEAALAGMEALHVCQSVIVKILREG